LNITPATWTSFLTINVFRKELLNLEFIKSNVDRVKAWSQLLMLAQATEKGNGLITPLLAVSQRTGNSSTSPYVFLKQLPDTFAFIFDLLKLDTSFRMSFFRKLSAYTFSFHNMKYLISSLKLKGIKIEVEGISEKIRRPVAIFYFKFLLLITPRFLMAFLTKLVRYYKGEGFNLGRKDLEERF